MLETRNKANWAVSAHALMRRLANFRKICNVLALMKTKHSFQKKCSLQGIDIIDNSISFFQSIKLQISQITVLNKLQALQNFEYRFKLCVTQQQILMTTDSVMRVHLFMRHLSSVNLEKISRVHQFEKFGRCAYHTFCSELYIKASSALVNY